MAFPERKSRDLTTPRKILHEKNYAGKEKKLLTRIANPLTAIELAGTRYTTPNDACAIRPGFFDP